MDRISRRIKQVQKNIARNMPQSRVNLDTSSGHRYFDCDTGEVYSSVTTKLRILANPIFSDRKMNRSMEYITDNFNKYAHPSTDGNPTLRLNGLSKLIEEAKE